MRLIFITIILIGAIICGYALVADANLEDGLVNIILILHPADSLAKGFRLPDQVDADITREYERLTAEHHRDHFIICGLGGCIFILGFAGLIIERKRNTRQIAANRSPELN